MTTKNATATPLIVKVKKEPPAADEIKDFAETAMNELLGWYGYDNVDRNDLARCASRLSASTNGGSGGVGTTTNSALPHPLHLATATATTTPSSSVLSHPRTSVANNTSRITLIVNQPTAAAKPAATQQSGGRRTADTTPDRCTPNSSPAENRSGHSSSPRLGGSGGKMMGAQQYVVPPTAAPAPSAGDEKSEVECGWCKRSVALGSPEFLATPEGPRYCSESCFSQSRRASFKRAKTCDWCKHVRHAVSYVDFQDGASQLQFCSDKCLNQYKMQIFCRETQAHLDQHPHLKEKGLTCGSGGTSDGSLITPDLWLRNCKSRSASPASDRSRSRSPSALSPLPPHRPVITLAPSSKLLSRPAAVAATAANAIEPTAQRVSPRVTRKRRSLRIVNSATVAAAATRCDRSLSSPAKPSTIVVQLNGSGGGGCGGSSTQSIATTTAAPPTLQDLTTNAQLRNISARLLLPKDVALNNHPQPVAVQSYHQFMSPLPNLYPVRTQQNNATSVPVPQTFMHRSGNSNCSGTGQQNVFPPGMHTLVGQQPQLQHRHIPQQQQQQHQQQQQQTPTFSPNTTPVNAMPQAQSQPDNAAQNRLFGGTSAPPITILVPYPVLVPVPIPIPIPMPIIAFLRAAQLKLDADNNNSRSDAKNADASVHSAPASAVSVGPGQAKDPCDEQPLDFTKTRELCAEDDPEQLIEVVCDDEDDDDDDDDDDNDVASIAESVVSDDDEIRAAIIRSTEPNIRTTVNEPLPKFKITRLNSRRGFITTSSDKPVLSTNNTTSSNQIMSSLISNRPNGNYDSANALKSGGCRQIAPSSEPNVVILPQQQQQQQHQQQHTAVIQSASASAACSETSRPLRKRKRVVDGDYSRFKDDERKKNHSASEGALK